MSGCVTCDEPTPRRQCRDCELAERHTDENPGWGSQHWDDEDEDDDEEETELIPDGGTHTWAGPGDDGTPPDASDGGLAEARRDVWDEYRDAVDAPAHHAIGEGDIVIDLVDHKRLRVREKVADSIPEHVANGGENLLANGPHPWLPVTIDDSVFACEYVKEIDELHRHGDEYPFPSGRLARVPERVGDWEGE